MTQATKSITRRSPLYHAARWGYHTARAAMAWPRRLLAPAKMRQHDRLHLGSGARHMPGWANVDVDNRGEIIWDLRKRLPIPQGKVRFVYSEHFVEHVERHDLVALLANVREVLADDGVVRISTPDLAVLAADYVAGRTVGAAHGGWNPESPAQMVNGAVRNWGHQFIYDEAELFAVLREAGFDRMQRVARGESEHAELRALESRPDLGDLIVEAMI